MSTKELIEAALKLDPVEHARLADTIRQNLSESEIGAIEDAEDEARASLNSPSRAVSDTTHECAYFGSVYA
jgi:hypothetical protein